MLPCYDESMESIVGVPSGIDPQHLGSGALAPGEDMAGMVGHNYSLMASLRDNKNILMGEQVIWI